MTIDKRMKYEMQGGTKPARNYLGAQKTVSGIPVKWKSGPDAPSTELAYITKAEKDLILKKNLHGSLKNGPNTGPDGIMSLDSQGDYTRDRSPQGRSRQGQAQHDQHMRSILTGQKNIGQTTKTGPKTRKYAVPEYVKVKQPDGTYKNKYIGSGYKSYGTPSFWGNLFSRGAPGYRGIKGMPAFFGKPKFGTKGTPGGPNFGYYSDYEKFGDTRDPVPLGIMGLIANAINKFKKPKDMTEFNKLGLGGTHPAALDFDPNAKIQDTAFSKTVTPNTRAYGPWTQGDIEVSGLGDQEILDELAAEESSQAWDNFVPPTGTHYPGSYDPNDYYTGTLSFEDQIAKNKAKLESLGFTEAVDKVPMPDFMYSSPQFTEGLDNTMYGGDRRLVGSKDGINYYTGDTFPEGHGDMPSEYGITKYDFDNDNVPSDADIFSERFVDASTGSPYTSSQDALLKQHGYDPYGVGTWKNQEGLNLIKSLTDWNTRVANGGIVGYANGGLASLFTRRG